MSAGSSIRLRRPRRPERSRLGEIMRGYRAIIPTEIGDGSGLDIGRRSDPKQTVRVAERKVWMGSQAAVQRLPAQGRLMARLRPLRQPMSMSASEEAGRGC